MKKPRKQLIDRIFGFFDSVSDSIFEFLDSIHIGPISVAEIIVFGMYFITFVVLAYLVIWVI